MSLLLLFNQPTSSTDITVSAGYNSSTYNLNNVSVGIGSTQNPNSFDLTYSLTAPSFIQGTGVKNNASILNSTYSLITPTFIQGVGTLNAVSVINSTYSLTAPSLTQGVGNRVSANSITASYNIQSPSVVIKVTIPTSVLSASYNQNTINQVIAGSGQKTIVSELVESYSLQSVSAFAKINTQANVNTLSASYNLENAAAFVKYVMRIFADPISASYNINSVSTTTGSQIVVSASTLSASYSELIPTIKNSFTMIPNVISAIFGIADPLEKTSSKVSVSNLTASYSENSPSISINAYGLVNILSVSYSENSPTIINGNGVFVNPTNLQDNFDLTTVTIHATAKNLASILSAGYSIDNPDIHGNAKTLQNILSLSYSLIDPSIHVQTVVNCNELTTLVNIEDVNIFTQIQYTFSADELKTIYIANIPEVIIAIPEWFNTPQVPFNSYWRDDTECKDNERFLYESLQLDEFNKFGVTWVYYPTTYNLTRDVIFKEDPNKMVVRCFSAKGMIEDIPPEQKSFKLEGIFGSDVVRAYFSKLHFDEASTYSDIVPSAYPSVTPLIGDYIYLGSNDIFYEVINVKDTIEQFQNRPHSYELVLRVYKDNKLTVSAGSLTLINDRILSICTSATSATTQFNDYLAINSDVETLVSAIKYIPKTGEKDPFGGW